MTDQDDDATSFVYSQRNKPLLLYKGYLFNKNKTITSQATTKIVWQCERRRDTHCSIYVTMDINGRVIKHPTSEHIHALDVGRVSALNTRRVLLTATKERLDASPAVLLNELITPDVALALLRS